MSTGKKLMCESDHFHKVEVGWGLPQPASFFQPPLLTFPLRTFFLHLFVGFFLLVGEQGGDFLLQFLHGCPALLARKLLLEEVGVEGGDLFLLLVGQVQFLVESFYHLFRGTFAVIAAFLLGIGTLHAQHGHEGQKKNLFHLSVHF